MAVALVIVSVVIIKSFENRSPISIIETFQTEKSKKAACPDPFIFPLPIDINKVTSILYPGQVRGGDFKAHGGFRFENSLPSDILVTAPIDANVIAGARYPVNTGDIQYTFQVYPPIEIKRGEVIATAVGMTKDGSSKNGTNTFLDWGVYDYRQKNEVSKDPIWATSHSSDIYQYAVCWFDWISPKDKEKVLALPSSDGKSGKTSDYCK